MDLTSKISLATAIIEFIVVAWAYFKFERTPLSNLVVSLLIILGLAQFCEYELCISKNYLLWGKLGFIIYTIIPSLVLFYAISTVKKKKYYWLFLPYLGFVLTAIIKKGFVLVGECHFSLSFVVTAFYLDYNNTILSIFNFIYIASFSMLSGLILLNGAKITNNIYEKKIYYLIGASIAFSFLLPLAIIIIWADLRLYFPSIIGRCLTSYLFTGIISLYLEQKIIEQTKIKNPEY